jgi:UDP-2,3-diacylglucosamine pyrophosphatase LpxH
MESDIYDVVILSDLHLGSEISRANEALSLIRSLKCRRLILLGDIFCDLNFRRLKKEHWLFLSYIRKLSNPKRGVEVVWVEGNHDYGLSEVMSHMMGIPVYKEFIWQSHGEAWMAIHGHQFDNFIIKNRLFMDGLAYSLYLSIQKASTKGMWLARFMDKLNTQWQRLTPKIAEGAIHYAKNKGISRVFCGHTHDAIAIEKHGVFYYNTGAWTHKHPTFIKIKGNEVTINEYVEGTNNYYSGEERREASAQAFNVPFDPGLSTNPDYEGAFS